MEFSRPLVVQQQCHVTFTLDFQGKIRNFCIPGMEGSIDMERKWCESIECWSHVVTFNFNLIHDLDIGFSK